MGLAISVVTICDRCGTEQFHADIEPANVGLGVLQIAKNHAPEGWVLDDDLVCCPGCRVLCSLCEKPVGGDYRNATFTVQTRFSVRACALCAECRARIPHPPAR